MKANNQSSTGTVKFLYSHIKTDIYKKGNEGGEQKKRGLISFIANTFALKKSNPALMELQGLKMLLTQGIYINHSLKLFLKQ